MAWTYLIYNLKQLFTFVNGFRALLKVARGFSLHFAEDSFEGISTFCTLCLWESKSFPNQSSNNLNPNPTTMNISGYNAPTFLYLFTPLQNFNINIGRLCSWKTNIINVSLETWIKNPVGLILKNLRNLDQI